MLLIDAKRTGEEGGTGEERKEEGVKEEGWREVREEVGERGLERERKGEGERRLWRERRIQK